MLAERGLYDGASRFRLGFVSEPLQGHERYRGMLAVPYLRRAPSGWSVVAMRFRCIEPRCTHDYHGKYNSVPGDPPRLFNTVDLQRDTDTIAVCEGELDTISAVVSGVPAVGVAGTQAWLPHFAAPFAGYRTVFILADNDRPRFYDDCDRCQGKCRGHNPGMEFAESLAKTLRNAKIVPCALGEDLNSELVKNGPESIRRKVMA